MPIIDFRIIPHDEQRYETVGDYWREGDTLHFRSSRMRDSRYEWLVFLHEMIELRLCEEAGIPTDLIDAFDIDYEKARADGAACAPCGCKIQEEPGFDVHAPYYMMHKFAAQIEQTVAFALGVNWVAYATEVSALAKPLLLDNGHYASMAARMARDTPVAYFSSWVNSFPVSREFAPGTGIPDVERVDDPISFMLDGKASHVIVPDLYLNGYERLARELGIPTFGAGEGNKIETDRWFLKEWLAEHDMPVNYSVQVPGVDELAKHLSDITDKYIKVSVFRGDHETAHHETWDKSKIIWFNKLQHTLGKMGDEVKFIVEDPITDALEIGIDDIVRRGKFLLPAIIGCECKDAGYFGWLVDKMPRAFEPIVAALGEYFAAYDYNCFFSNEMRIAGSDIYMTDATCRIPSPPGGVMMAGMNNFTDMVLKDANPDYGNARFFYEIILKSDLVMNSWLPVEFPKELADRYAFHNYCIRDGKVWIIPHDSKYVEFGSALGWGASKDAAREMCIEAAEAVKANSLRFDVTELTKAEETVSGVRGIGL